ncbi:MAG: transporter substrate-binding domain-containing protein [Butyrivibrio sp.]
MKKKIAFLLCAVMACVTLVSGCGKSGKSEKVYAVEAGSAGEEIAKEKGYKINSVGAQADALMEVEAGTSDAAIIDMLMAGAMIGEGTSYADLKQTAELTTEEYGIGCRKGSDLASFINSILAKKYADGTMTKLAEQYKIRGSLVIEQRECEYTASESDSDVEYIKNKGKLVVGMTLFAPMDYQEDGSDEIVGYDADLAREVGKELGVDVEFVIIDWDSKIMELNSKNIDVVWNGMTLTDDVRAAMECTNAYLSNAQVVVEKDK